jgi:ATP-binding cassette subfamily B protein
MFHDDDQPRRFNLSVWLRVLRLARPYLRHAVGLGLMAVSIAACETLMPYLTGRIIDRVESFGVDAVFWRLAGAYVAVVVGICTFIAGFILLAGRIASGVSHDIRHASFAKLQQLSFSYFDRRPVGWLMSRLTSDCDRLSRIIGWTLLDFVWGFSLIFGIATAMLFLNWRLGLLVLLVTPPMAAASAFFQRKLLHSARAIRKSNAEITAAFNESIMGVRTTKALVREDANLSEFQEASSRMYEHSVRNALQSALYLPLIISMGSIMAGLALWFGGVRVLEGVISIGVLVSFINYAGLFFEPVQQMARQLTELQMAGAAAERIVKLLNTDPAIKDSPEVQAALAANAHRPRSPEMAPDGFDEQIHTIEFRNVGFTYEGGEKVLEGFNLTVHAGETIALVGATGGGKTTIVSLLCRFYEPTVGEVLLNGVDYRRRSLAWHQRQLGIVLQAPHLFSGSIRENILYGRLNAAEEEIIAAAKLAGAHEFIVETPGDYEAEVGEGGNRLSTGQKQLIALARAILADPQIFVMDEATSSVDTETEQLIQQGVERVLEGRTSFIIAHRLSTIRSADRILVIERGRVVEVGAHDELLARRGRYFDLYRRQFSEQRLAELLPEGA